MQGPRRGPGPADGGVLHAQLPLPGQFEATAGLVTEEKTGGP
ncbi:MAG TPA: hypothetical protein VFR64_16710 [Methylomirabilota bacterium]|nr:hypothetical protein [Methylomirabilota bacterium]